MRAPALPSAAQGVVCQGVETGMVGMKKDSRRVIVLPPAYSAAPLQPCVYVIELHKVKWEVCAAAAAVEGGDCSQGHHPGGAVVSALIPCCWGGPQYANYWAPLTRQRHTMPHPAQPQHTNHWAPRTRKRHQQEHQQRQPTERSDPTQYAKGRTGDCPGPHKETAKRRNVIWGGGGWFGLAAQLACAPIPDTVRVRGRVRVTELVEPVLVL